MPFKLPKLTTDIDCEPIGYPGLVVTCWLNVTPKEWEPPWGEMQQFEDAEEQEQERKRFEAERNRILAERPWERLYYHGMARIFERFTFPPEMTESGEQEIYEIPDAETLHGLLVEPTFDQAIVTWAQSVYQNQRQERLEAALKN